MNVPAAGYTHPVQIKTKLAKLIMDIPEEVLMQMS